MRIAIVQFRTHVHFKISTWQVHKRIYTSSCGKTCKVQTSHHEAHVRLRVAKCKSQSLKSRYGSCSGQSPIWEQRLQSAKQRRQDQGQNWGTGSHQHESANQQCARVLEALLQTPTLALQLPAIALYRDRRNDREGQTQEANTSLVYMEQAKRWAAKGTETQRQSLWPSTYHKASCIDPSMDRKGKSASATWRVRGQMPNLLGAI